MEHNMNISARKPRPGVGRGREPRIAMTAVTTIDRGQLLRNLRREVSGIERASGRDRPGIAARPDEAAAGPGPIAEWVRGAHEIRSAGENHRGAATGFALALAAARGGKLVWITSRRAAGEGGAPHGPGIAAFGLDPDGVFVLVLDKPVDTLIGAEEALACSALGTVLLEVEGDPAALDATAARRLKLRAAESGIALLVARHAARGDGLPLDRRWRVAAAPSVAEGRGLLGLPAFAATLEKNRLGPIGHHDIVWSSHDRVFLPARRLPVDPLRAPRARPARAA